MREKIEEGNILALKSKKMLNLQQSSTSALDNNTTIPLMTHFTAL